ncbi:L,D-transpeptidase [Cellulophaga sp. L1A9]|uniref:L,D-transpeptidase n=1 Tax=Cellulophaga sp. L1A9 TaxID=2686362 RepID=UPI00131E7C8C|nr:L,D-transpeptidase [Cellulophaga sp. L1A9]
MNIEYPYNIKSLTDSLKSSNRFGIYPIGKFNAWHGGIHIEGDSHVKCIADGRVIAYRIPTKYFYEDIGKGKDNPKYSNGFVLMQHYYKSEEGLEFTFYSLYNHLMSKKDYEKDDYSKKKIPDVLAEFSYIVSDQAKDAINGLEVYKLNSEKELDRTNPVFLKYKTTVDTLTNNGKEILLEKDKRYKKIECKDYEGNTHSDVYVSKGLIVNGKANYKGDKSPKKGVIVYEEAKDTSEQLRVIEKNTKSTKIKIDKKKSTNEWLKLEDEEGFIKNDDNLTKTKTIDADNLIFDKVVKSDGLLKAGTIIGHTGLFDSPSISKYRAAHVEVFSFEDPKDFLKGGKDAEKEENKKFLKIDKGAELQLNLKISVSIKKHTPVKILEIDDNYCKIQIIKPSAEVFHKHLYDGYDDGKGHYTIKADYTEIIDGVEKEIKCYEIIKASFGKYLTADSKLYSKNYSIYKNTEKREAEYRPEHHDQTFWVKNNTAIQKENAESTLIKPVKNDEFILAEDIKEYYISKPSTESDTIITKEILRINSASIPKHKDGEKQYYKITYNKKEGWIKTDDTKIKKISAFNWEEFGFETMDAGDEYCYSVKDVENNIETSPFLEKIWKTIDENNDNIIDENEWNRAKNTKVLSQFSKLVCKHKSEWSYTESEIEKEIKEYYKIGLNQATGDKKKNLEKKQDENIALLKKRVKNTCFWDKVEKGEQETKSTFSNLSTLTLLPAAFIYYYFTNEEKKESDKKNIRTFKTSQKNVWHFHPIAFIEQMKLITGGVNHTFDNKYKATGNEVYINVITPKGRDLEGPLVVFDSSGILFKTHSLCRGSSSDRFTGGGNGDTPTGKASTSYDSIRHKGEYSYGNYGLIDLIGLEGEFKKATSNGRAGIAIHCGHTSGYYKKSLEDIGKLMGTHGCIRVYNNEMKKLGELYSDLKSQGKKIYCYIEDHDGDINDVYKFYDLKRDIKDKSRGARSANQ